MLRHCLLLLFTLQTCLLAGQEENPENCSSLSFQKRMGGDLDDKGMAIRQTAFGEYLLAGFTGDLSSPETQDALLVKLDKHGGPVWGKTYGGSGKDHFSRLIIDRDGNYIALGATHSAHASGAMLAVKTDTTGNILWSREYFFRGPDYQGFIEASALIELPDGRIAFAANTAASNIEEGALFGAVYPVVGILNTNGSVSWVRRLKPHYWLAGGRVTDMIADGNSFILAFSGLFTGLIQLRQSDGSLVGMQKQYTDVQPFHSLAKNGTAILVLSDEQLSVFDKNLDLLRTVVFRGPAQEKILLKGLTEDGLGLFGQSSVVANIQDPFLLRINEQFQPQWRHIFPGDRQTDISGITATGDKALTVIGASSTRTDEYNTTPLSRDIYLLKTDPEGKINDCPMIPAQTQALTDPIPRPFMEMYIRQLSISASEYNLSLNVSNIQLPEEQLCKGECDTANDTETFCHTPNPLNLGGDTTLCEGDTMLLQAPDGYRRYLWNTGDVGSSMRVAKEGSYWVRITDDRCEWSDTLTIARIFKRPSGFLPDTITVCNGYPVKLQSSASFARYRWDDGSAVPYTLAGANGIRILEATDQNGCSGADTTVVIVEDCLNREVLYFPNAFTPGSATNNLFKPAVSVKTDKYQLLVYNRYGQKVFESADPRQGWDGSFKGIPQNTGSFIWYCRYRLNGAGEAEAIQRGTVTLIR
ncbi:MAG: gliding motility-associated C-terminal domain-containing protein [Chitinophagaceae bacterium]|nr:gliding motility-associated C-terminal domain-containing protein [Chitinophagaceae bacterium]